MKMESKYDVGDVVYYGDAHRVTKKAPCPDCLDSGSWVGRSPAGDEYKFPCPRCSASYLSDRELSLYYQAYSPTSERRTIGSIRFSTDGETQYMCHETGVGSGMVYSESSLHKSEEDALKAAQAIAAAGDLRPDIKTMRDRAIRISDYQLSDAKIQIANAIKSESQQDAYKFHDLIEDLKACETIESVRRSLDWHERAKEQTP